jgi:hypothetical protein
MIVSAWVTLKSPSKLHTTVSHVAHLPVNEVVVMVVFVCTLVVHRDLDLLRDAGLTCADPARRWKCKHCSNRINTEEIENR